MSNITWKGNRSYELIFFCSLYSGNKYLSNVLPHTSMQYKMFRSRPMHRTFRIGRFAPRAQSLERHFAPQSYFRKTFHTKTIFQKDAFHPNHFSERRFAHKSYRKDVSHPFYIIGKTFGHLIINQHDICQDYGPFYY